MGARTGQMDARETADRLAIDGVLSCYAWAVDSKDWDLLATVFTDDAVVDYSDTNGPKGSASELIAWLRETLAPFSMTQHLVTNRDVRIEGGEATARSMFFNPMGVAGAERALGLMLCGGTYEDRLRRTPDGWRICERVHRMTWIVGGLEGRDGI